MRNINKVILIGNLTRDPELRHTSNGQNVCTFGVATNREWITSDSRQMSSTEFHECVAWAKLAEVCDQYLKKGKLVYIEGYLKTRSWDTPEGVKRFRTEIIVQDMIMLEKRKKEGADYIPQTTGEPDSHAQAENKEAVAEKEEPEKANEEGVTIEGDLGL